MRFIAGVLLPLAAALTSSGCITEACACSRRDGRSSFHS
jgi:hypothetical protein